MLRSLYGKRGAYPPTGVSQMRSRAPLAGERPPERPLEQPRPEIRCPWDGHQDAAACHVTIRHFLRELPLWLEVDGRAHAETCLAASGALAGFAAQHVLIAQSKAAGDAATLRQLHTIRTIKRGELLFGEPLDRALLPVSDADADSKLWTLAAAAAISSGLHPSRLPNPQQIFTNVVNNLGGPHEGFPFVPRQHAPQRPARHLLEELWPVTLMCLSGQIQVAPREYGAASMKHWPAIAAHVASALIRQTRAAVDPRIAFLIVMESAIYGSKLTLPADDQVTAGLR